MSNSYGDVEYQRIPGYEINRLITENSVKVIGTNYEEVITLDYIIDKN